MKIRRLKYGYWGFELHRGFFPYQIISIATCCTFWADEIVADYFLIITGVVSPNKGFEMTWIGVAFPACRQTKLRKQILVR